LADGHDGQLPIRKFHRCGQHQQRRHDQVRVQRFPEQRWPGFGFWIGCPNYLEAGGAVVMFDRSQTAALGSGRGGSRW